MDNTTYHLLSILKLNTRLWLNCLEKVTDEIAQNRPGLHTNDLGFLALHLVDARYYMADYLGFEVANPYKEALAHVHRIEDLKPNERPSIEDLRSAWREISKVLHTRFPDVHAKALLEDSPQRFPVEDKSKYGGLMFLLQHESYHIGQMALLRKYVGLDAMTYP